MITTLRGFIDAGGMASVEREAAERAIITEREAWLPILEAWAAALDAAEDDLIEIVWLDAQIRRLRRLLGLPHNLSPDAEERRRQQTKERVRRFRQRQRAAQ